MSYVHLFPVDLFPVDLFPVEKKKALQGGNYLSDGPTPLRLTPVSRLRHVGATSQTDEITTFPARLGVVH